MMSIDVPDIDMPGRRLRLTPRWTPLRPHPMQSLMMWHPAPIKVCPAGRRSGKTEIGKRKAVLQLLRKRDWPSKVLIGAPTHDQVRTIYWDDIKSLMPRSWISSINETRMEIRTFWGGILRLAGLDRPERIEGTPWDWMLIDELANCPKGLLDLHLLPALGTVGRTVSCDLIGVPDEVGPNQAEYERYWELGLAWPKDQKVCSFWWPSSDILESEKIEEFRSRMDPLQFEQEMQGRFITSGGKALPSFDVKVHVRGDFCEYDERLPLDWSLDFGVDSHAAALVGQAWRGHVWIIDEIVLPAGGGGGTDTQVIALRDWAQRFGIHLPSIRLRRFGDAAGGKRGTNTGKSDYAIIDEMTRDLRMDHRELRVAPAIKDTLNAVRGRLATADRVVHLHIHPRCKKLIEQCKTAPWPDKLEKFHCLAALRYYCYELFGGEEIRYETAPQREASHSS